MAELIKIEPGQHCAFVGINGSGKTVLALRLLRDQRRVIAVDPKHKLGGEGWHREFNIRPWWKEFRVVWRPRRGDDHELGDKLYKALRKGHLIIYCDELTTLSKFFPYSEEVLADIIRTGREAQVSVWDAMQRAAWVDRYFISECYHRFSFTLADADDRKRMAEIIGDAARTELPLHDFLYSRLGLTKPLHLRYNIPQDKIVKVGPSQAEEP